METNTPAGPATLKPLPWFQEIELVRRAHRRAVDQADKRARRIGFIEGLHDRDADELAVSFAGEPRVDDPEYGRIEGRDAFQEYVASKRDWLGAQNGSETTSVTTTSERTVEETLVRLAEGGERRYAIVSDLDADGLLVAIRVYQGPTT